MIVEKLSLSCAHLSPLFLFSTVGSPSTVGPVHRHIQASLTALCPQIFTRTLRSAAVSGSELTLATSDFQLIRHEKDEE